MFRLAQRPSGAFRSLLSRNYSTPANKVPLALVAELRKETQVSIAKAREALTHSNGSIPDALEWLKKDLVTTGKAKAEKVSSRATNEGVIAISVLSHGAGLDTAGGVRASIIELNCETDFVARNELFNKLASDIAHTAAFISEVENKGRPRFTPFALEELKDAPFLCREDPSALREQTVTDAIRETIVKVGEKISLRRATTIVEYGTLAPTQNSALRLGSYVHGALHGMACGRVGALALANLRSPRLHKFLQDEAARAQLPLLERSLARQIVGFDTLAIRTKPKDATDEQVLYSQPFITLAGEFNGLPVGEALEKWSIANGLSESGEEVGIEVLDFQKWTVGEALN